MMYTFQVRFDLTRPEYCRNKGFYMSAYVLLNVLNLLKTRILNARLDSHFISFSKRENTRA